MFLAGCRNIPLARSMQRTVARRSASAGAGSFEDLNEDLPGDEPVANAAEAGTTPPAPDPRLA